MHIPDGYLAPQTAIPVLAGMAPVWGAALRNVQKHLGERKVPALALCASFAFVLMMFNIPVAGGSSAHAVGAVFIAVLLGPWPAVLSISAALFIQALLFGDGGILTFGVNCLNMAVVMPFFGYFIHRLVAGNARPGSRRYFAGAFAGGYLGLNLAALFAGVELGVQPLLFHTAGGTPLYCPYPLSVSVPAMLFAHAVFAGPLEGFVTAGALAYAARFAPSLFEKGTPLHAKEPKAGFFHRYKPLLILLVTAAAITPLGLLAGGTAFGESGVAELKAKLGYIPRGLAALAEKWHALLPDYSLPAAGGHSVSAAVYILCAVSGMAAISVLILLTAKGMGRLRKNGAGQGKKHERG